MSNNFLTSALREFRYYKLLGEKAMAQVPDEALLWQYNEESNSIAVIVKHLYGNMRSRWTDFLTSDGEKPWRARDEEFEEHGADRQTILRWWEEGWACCFGAIETLQETDLERTVYIRNEPHTVLQAVNRQLAHYPYHVGQIVFLARMLAGAQWHTLSIAKNQSQQFNERKMAGEDTSLRQK